jgi:hypothetical protein
VTQAGSSPRQKKKGRAGSYLARFKTLSRLKRERLVFSHPPFGGRTSARRHSKMSVYILKNCNNQMQSIHNTSDFTFRLPLSTSYSNFRFGPWVANMNGADGSFGFFCGFVTYTGVWSYRSVRPTGGFQGQPEKI